MENNNFVSGLRQTPVAVVTVSGCDKAHAVSLSTEAKQNKKKTGRWELMNEASATHISCTSILAHREAPRMLVIPCKYCWAGKEAEREAVVVGPAA